MGILLLGLISRRGGLPSQTVCIWDSSEIHLDIFWHVPSLSERLEDYGRKDLVGHLPKQVCLLGPAAGAGNKMDATTTFDYAAFTVQRICGWLLFRSLGPFLKLSFLSGIAETSEAIVGSKAQLRTTTPRTRPFEWIWEGRMKAQELHIKPPGALCISFLWRLFSIVRFGWWPFIGLFFLRPG